VEETLLSFKNQTSGIGPITLFDSVYRGKLPVGEVKISNEKLCLKLSAKPHVTRTALLGIHAAREAVTMAGIDLK
jgi:3-oxoacyl-[acyl-carrier-protein] synthase-1